MKARDVNSYRLQSSNQHLLNILEENYYIELGAVNLFLLSRLLKGLPLYLIDFFYPDITKEGIGKIVDGSDSELLLQLTYLFQIRQRSSSNKIFLTSGVIKYLNDNQQELYAPLILIPVEIDPSNGTIVKSSDAIVNSLLIRRLRGESNLTYNERITDIIQIDRIGLDFAKRTNTVYKIDNYLTYGKVEYRDFIIPHDFLEIDRSLYETEARTIIRDYFKEVKAILPTNIYQKNVILKASRKSNIAIDGRIGSGKTYTIVNIIADKILKGKKVLYINQDLDNIWDLERHLSFIGLSNHIYNFVKMTDKTEMPSVVKPTLSADYDTIDCIVPIEKFEKNLKQKIHGFSYQFIIESLAILTNQYPNEEEILIEVDLEKFEVEKIASLLDEIEQTIKTIDPFSANLWRGIESYYSMDHIPEIIDRTKKFALVQQELIEFLAEFYRSFNLRFPKNIREVNKLIVTLRNFMITPPPFCWSDSFQFDDAHQAIIAISVWQEKHYELVNYYQTIVNDKYSVGLAKKMLERLYYKHLNKHDGVYINRLLSKKSSLQNLIQEISKHRNNIYQAEKRIKVILNSKRITSTYYSLFKKINHFMESNEILLPWVKVLVKEKFDDGLEKKINLIRFKIQNIVEQLTPHLVKPEQFTYCIINNLINNKRYPNNLKRLFKKQTLKTISFQELIINVNHYHDLAHQLNTSLLTIERLVDCETQWRDFLTWFDFYHNLNNDELKLFRKILTVVNWNRPNTEQEIFKLINDFYQEVEYFQSIFEHLKIYRIIISDNEILEQINEYLEWESYLKDVISVKKTLKRVITKGIEFTHRDLVELANMDEEFIILGETIDEKKEYYQNLLGEHYKGINTDCVTISKLIDHFDEFSETILGHSDLAKILEPQQMKEMTSNYFTLDRLYERWMNHYRHFSRYFHGGQAQFYDLDLPSALEKINLFKNNLNQLAPMLLVLSHYRILKSYGLEALSNGIKTSKYVSNIKDRYLYSTYRKIRRQFESSNNELVNKSDVLSSLERFSRFEKEKCTENIITLIKEAELIERKLKIRFDNISFHEYNRILEATERIKSLYLGDINIFNSNLDLSHFDTVIIDDGHLSSANKYHRIPECKQAIIFGDSSFRSSISNTLMKRIFEPSLIYFPYRYVNLGNRFKNDWNYENQYLYEYNQKIEVIGFDSLSEFVNHFIFYYNKKPDRIINIVITNDNTKRTIYSELTIKLKESYTDQEIIHILSYNIRLINALSEGNRYVNDSIIYYPDLESYDSSMVDLILKNFTVAKERVILLYLNSKSQEENEEIKNRINSLIGKDKIFGKHLVGIETFVLERLKKLDYKAEAGFGKFQIIIRDTFNVGIMILERNDSDSYSLIDDYHFYYEQYSKNGWLVKIIFTSDLIDNFDEVLLSLDKEIKNHSIKQEIVLKSNFPEGKI